MRYVCISMLVSVFAGAASTAESQVPTFTRDDYPSVSGARAIVSADFNRDGRTDLAQASTGADTVTIVLNHRDTGFSTASQVPVGKGPFAMATADLNRDGIADLAVANADADSISLLFGRGDGSFERRDLAAKGNPRGLTIADVNRDGVPDLVYTSYAANGVAAWVNDGFGTFRYHTSFVGYAQRPQGVVAADFNRDGQVDLAVAYDGPGGLALFYLTNGSFTAATPIAGAQNLNILATADLNADGWTDIVAAATWRDRVSVYLNSPSGFSYLRSYATGAWPGNVVLVDVNRDGRADIVTANRTSSNVSVLLADRASGGRFVPAVHFPAGPGSRALAVADFDADGRIDLATGNQYAPDVTVLSNTTAFVRAAFSFQRTVLGEPYEFGPGEDVWPGDFDRDGTMDVAIVNRTQNGIAVLLTAKPSIVVAAGPSLRRFAAGDFNGDGSLDFVAVREPGSGGAVLTTYVNNGRGEFTTPAPGILEWEWSRLAVADINRDGRDDIVAGRYDPYAREHVIDVLGAATNGSLVRLSRNVTDEAAEAFAVGDVNRDGKPDIISLPGVRLWLGDGAGALAPARRVDMPPAADVVLADMNRDGYLDLVLAEVYHVYVALGRGDGFGPANSFAFEIPGHIGDYKLAIADIDLDGTLDVVTKGANLLRGNGDGTLASPDRFDYFGTDVKVADFNGDGLPDIIIQSSESRAEILLNERNEVNHAPAVRMPDATFTYAEVLDCEGHPGSVYAQGADPDLHFVQWELRDEAGAIVSNEGGMLACPREYGAYHYSWKAWDGRGAVVTGTFTITYAPTTEIVLHVWINEDGIMGNWTPAYDSTAAGGMKAYDPNFGAPKVTAPLSSPSSYYELPFVADPTQTYKLWVRMKADRNSWANDSLWVQFSGSADAAGSPRYRIGTTSGLSVSLEECVNCGVSGWGWEDDGWGSVDRNGVLVRFPEGGRQLIRVQTREDGVSFDQIVLSAEKYLTTRPGPARNDATILPATQR
jgi:hypothetical protein